MRSPLQRLSDSHPGLEIWFDSSPLILESWASEAWHKHAGNGTGGHEDWYRSMCDLSDASRSLIKGATTNPPLSLEVIKRYPEVWDAFRQQLIKGSGSLSDWGLFWELYSEVIRRGAERLFPIFTSSSCKYGYISGQVDPRNLHDVKEMIREAITLNQKSRNIMVKMPGTKAGIWGIEFLTAMGIPTNATLTFTLSQLISVAESVRRGLDTARSEGVDLTSWRSVATLMLGRFEDNPEFDRQARSVGLNLTEDERRWAGIAVFKRAYRIFREREYPTKLLAASMRIGPSVDGRMKVWHVEKLAGEDIVMTLFPNVIEAFMINYADDAIYDFEDEGVPQHILEKLNRIPYFRQAYEEEAIATTDYAVHPALRETAEAFANACVELQRYVKIGRQ